MRKSTVIVKADSFFIRSTALLGAVHTFQNLLPPPAFLRIAVSAAVKSRNSAHTYFSFFNNFLFFYAASFIQNTSS